MIAFASCALGFVWAPATRARRPGRLQYNRKLQSDRVARAIARAERGKAEVPRHKYLDRIENLGFSNFVRYMAHKKTGLPRSGMYSLFSRNAPTPLLCRGGSSDIDVFKHVFVLREYQAIDDIGEPDFIVDCGANAGYSSAYFLSVYPRAHLVAIEPDSGNFRMLELNTAGFGDRCERLQAGIWSEPCGLRVVDSPVGDGREWARGVVVAGPGEQADIQAVGVADVLARSRFERISLLKVDIEGAEAVLFGPGAEEWLDRVDNIAIELHGDECTRIYHEAVDPAGFVSEQRGGLTLSRRSVSATRP